MKSIVEERREVPVIRETEVLVAGGGPGGQQYLPSIAASGSSTM